ncbi:unknown protein [Waddlia chondrophila 2032/99]|uniref:Uncharacterized protein n=1 Tax=Waddlia chondrophila 2032/99 TaxID=765953 RepID=F8LEM7_9BACT|nr:unknown protein [Waddlia chondrophila 2032/99]
MYVPEKIYIDEHFQPFSNNNSSRRLKQIRLVNTMLKLKGWSNWKMSCINSSRKQKTFCLNIPQANKRNPFKKLQQPSHKLKPFLQKKKVRLLKLNPNLNIHFAFKVRKLLGSPLFTKITTTFLFHKKT